MAVVVAIDLANTSASKAFKLSAETVAGRATHQIVGSGDDLADSVFTAIRVDLGFRDAAPVVEGFARTPADSSRTLQILGVDPLAEEPFRNFTGGPDSELDLGQFMSDGSAALLALPTARALQLEAGDSLTVGIGGIEKPLLLVGLMEPADEKSADAIDNLVVVDVSTAQELFGMKGRLSRIDLVIPDDDQTQTALSTIESQLPPGVEITRSLSRTETVEQMTRAFSLNLTALSLLALIVGMFLIYNTMTFSVVQRRSEIGRLRAIGVTKHEVSHLIIGEAALIGIVGTAIGLLTGFILGQGLVRLVSQTINDLYFVLRVQTVDLSTLTIVKGLVLGLGATIVAAVQPAREATRSPASTVLRRSEEEVESFAHRSRSSPPGPPASDSSVSSCCCFPDEASSSAISLSSARFSPLLS